MVHLGQPVLVNAHTETNTYTHLWCNRPILGGNTQVLSRQFGHQKKNSLSLPEAVKVVRAGEGEANVTKEVVAKEVGIVSIEEDVTKVTREETDTEGKNSESSTGEESMVFTVDCCSVDLVSSLSMFANTASVVSSIGSLGSGEVAGEGVEMLDICFLSRQNLVSLLS